MLCRLHNAGLGWVWCGPVVYRRSYISTSTDIYLRCDWEANWEEKFFASHLLRFHSLALGSRFRLPTFSHSSCISILHILAQFFVLRYILINQIKDF
jgi:hypothetical protein